MDALTSDTFCLQDLVTASANNDRQSANGTNGLSQSRSVNSTETATPTSVTPETTGFSPEAANSAYRFSAMQPFGCPSVSGHHFMSQPVQPLPLPPYAQVPVSHISPTVHSYTHGQPHQSSHTFNHMNSTTLRSPHTTHVPPIHTSSGSSHLFTPTDDSGDYSSGQTSCPLKNEDKRKGK